MSTVELYNLPTSILDMIKSEDIELVRLGACWVEAHIPQRAWQDMMGMAKRWFWSYIQSAEGKPYIHIIDTREFFGGNYYPYNTRGNSYATSSYTIYTGSSGYQMLQNQIQQISNQNQLQTLHKTQP